MFIGNWRSIKANRSGGDHHGKCSLLVVVPKRRTRTLPVLRAWGHRRGNCGQNLCCGVGGKEQVGQDDRLGVPSLDTFSSRWRPGHCPQLSSARPGVMRALGLRPGSGELEKHSSGWLVIHGVPGPVSQAEPWVVQSKGCQAVARSEEVTAQGLQQLEMWLV